MQDQITYTFVMQHRGGEQQLWATPEGQKESLEIIKRFLEDELETWEVVSGKAEWSESNPETSVVTL